jgi:glycolate oxidase FAD binding subunit
MSDPLHPSTIPELVEAVRSARRVVTVGAETKPRLSAVPPEFVRVSTTQLRGIVEYEPSEFTFTALAGTPLREIVAALAERGQYLPFDPVFAAAGGTLGGAVASGLSGPGRFRFGGLRDFILGVRFVDGDGRLLRMGGKVVKNAAGFDLPKFFVGSLGRFGALAEITFKVFPRAATTRTLRLAAPDAVTTNTMLSQAGSARWEIDALECPMAEDAVFVRLAGSAEALDVIAAEILGRWPGTTLTTGEASSFWDNVSEFGWAHSGGSLAKVVLTPTDITQFSDHLRTCAGARGWVGSGGNVGYWSVPAGTSLPPLLWPAVTLRGEGSLWPGAKPRYEVMRNIKAALDPTHRFPGLDE